MIKLNAIGELIWQKSLGGSTSDEAYSIQQTTDGGFIVAGSSISNDGDVSGNHGNNDYWIVKLTSDTLTGIASPASNIISIFPNPVQSQLTITLEIPASEVTIHVYDLQGRVLDCGFRIDDFEWSNRIHLNTENLVGGFYTLQIIVSKTGHSVLGKFVK